MLFRVININRAFRFSMSVVTFLGCITKLNIYVSVVFWLDLDFKIWISKIWTIFLVFNILLVFLNWIIQLCSSWVYHHHTILKYLVNVKKMLPHLILSYKFIFKTLRKISGTSQILPRLTNIIWDLRIHLLLILIIQITFMIRIIEDLIFVTFIIWRTHLILQLHIIFNNC